MYFGYWLAMRRWLRPYDATSALVAAFFCWLGTLGAWWAVVGTCWWVIEGYVGK
jgi:hypothetical protein